MAVAKMAKVSIALHSSHKEELLKRLQEKSLLHITKIEEEGVNEGVNEFDEADEKEVRQLENRLNILDDSIEFLRKFVKPGGFFANFIPQKLPVSEGKYNETTQNFNFEKVTGDIEKCDTELTKLNAEKEHLLMRKETIEPWLSLEIPMESVSPTKTTILLPGSVSSRLYNEKTLKKAEESGLIFEKVGELRNEIFLISVFHRNDEEEARGFLDIINFAQEDFRGFEGKPIDINNEIDKRLDTLDVEMEEHLERCKELVDYYEMLLILYDHTVDEITRLKAAKDAARTKTAYIIEGWVERSRKEVLEKLVNSFDAVIFLESKPKNGEEAPVKLVNRGFFKPFEIVTQMYGNPRYNELDPSPLLALFFAVFFGLCLTDAGYGIVLAIIALLLMRKIPEGKKFLWLIFIGAMFTIVEGALLGGWFGNLFSGTFLERPINSMMLFDPMKSYFIFYRLALVVGVIQIFFGLFIKLYEDIKDKRLTDAFFDETVWIILLSSIFAMLFSTDFCIQLNLSSNKLLPQSFLLPSFSVFSLCALLVILFGARDEKNPFFRLFVGFLRLLVLGGIFSYLGDFLSYIRLMALGLVTAGIAGAINDIAKMALGIPVIGVIFFVIILIAGHLFNIGINTLGGFVHTLRLQYVEFFQKFFIGGGKAFNPLRRNEKYIVLKET